MTWERPWARPASPSITAPLSIGAYQVPATAAHTNFAILTPPAPQSAFPNAPTAFATTPTTFNLGSLTDVTTGTFEAAIHWSNNGPSPYAYFDNWMDDTLSVKVGSPAGGDFGLTVAFGSLRRHFPGMDEVLDLKKRAVRIPRQGMDLEPAIRQTTGQEFTEQRSPICGITMRACAQPFVEVEAGREIDGDSFPAFPIRRDLEDRGTAQTAMREQHLFLKQRFSGTRFFGAQRRDDFG